MSFSSLFFPLVAPRLFKTESVIHCGVLMLHLAISRDK